jgi:hypothetical protein
MKFRYQPSYTVNRFPLGKYTSQSETPISVDDQYDFSKDQEQVCQWGINRKTTLILTGTYILYLVTPYGPTHGRLTSSIALVLAVTHTVVFRYLDGKYEDDPKARS